MNYFILRSLRLWGSKLYWPLTSHEIINIFVTRKPIHDFLSNFYWHFLSISYGFRYIRLQSVQGLTLTFDLWRSLEVENIFFIQKPIHDFLYNSYWHFLSISYRFRDIRIQSFQGLTLTFRGHQRSKIFSPFESPCMTSYLTSIDTCSLSRTVFEIFDFKVSGFDLDLWPSKVTRGQKKFHYSKAHTWLPI